MKISEIAEKAGVSIGTVDRVLHNRGRVSQKNIDRIMAIVQESGYEPNQYARSLRQNREYVIGVMIPSLGSEYGYWTLVAEGIDRASTELRAMQVSFSFAFFNRYEPSSVAVAAKELTDRHADALIIAPLLGDEIREVLSTLPDIPYVFIDSSLPDMTPVADFSQDPTSAGAVAARLMHLLKPDAHLFLTVQPHKAAFNGEMRALGFLEWIKANVPQVTVVQTHLDIRGSLAEGMDDLFGRTGVPDGIFVVNDASHIFSEVLVAQGRKSRIAVIGFDMVGNNRQALLESHVDAIISQRPAEQAYDAAMTLYRYLVLGQRNQTEGHTPIDIFIKENTID